MNSLRSALQAYVSVRRGMGCKFRYQEKQLQGFLHFMEDRGAGVVTNKLAMEWATLPPDSFSTRTSRIGCVRGFAHYLSSYDSRTEVPPIGVFSRASRPKPYLYTETEIIRLLEAALKLPPADGLRRWTYHSLFGLLAVSGLRISEALMLHRDDVDLERGVLTIRHTKYDKSRLVPIHASTCRVLHDYAARRDTHLHPPRTLYFFVAEQGNHLLHWRVRRVFWELSRQTGLRRPEDHTGPRIHDFRHTVAVKVLLNWDRTGKDAELLVPVLSTLLGHSQVRDTYWYLSTCPELLGQAVKRLEKHWGETIMKPTTPALSVLIERFFTERLIQQKRVSPHTIASYRDTLRLLFKFAEVRLHTLPSELTLLQLDVPLIAAFLNDLETHRSVSTRTRNLRLTAIRSFFHFLSFEEPAYGAHIQRVLAIPAKRHQRKLVLFLTRPEVEALLAAPDRTTWVGRRDHTLLLRKRPLNSTFRTALS